MLQSPLPGIDAAMRVAAMTLAFYPGGSNLQAIRYAIMPQALPVILSVILYNFESNARSGMILGIVGAGGTGFLLADRMHAFRWPEAWSIIFMIIAMST